VVTLPNTYKGKSETSLMQLLSWKVSEKAIQWSLEHALGKIILPSQASALRDREEGISAVNNINNEK